MRLHLVPRFICFMNGSREEEAIDVRSVDLCVTQRAGLIFLRLVVERRRAGNRGVDRQRVTLETHRIHLAAREQARIGGAVRDMTRDAALDLHRLVFENKGTRLIGMAGEANRVLSRRGAQLSGYETAVLIVTVGAFHQAFIDAMVKRLAELRPHVLMAPIAKPRLAIDQQKLRLLCVMRGMTVSARHVIAAMRGAQEIAVFFAVLVAGQAARGNLFRRRALEDEYLGLIASPGHMRFAGTMAGFAPLKTGPAPRVQSRLPVRRFLKGVIDLVMAGLACLRADIS